MAGGDRPAPPPRRWPGRLVRVLLGLFLGLLAAEVGLRLLGYSPGGLYRHDSVLGWTLREDVVWRTSTPEYRTAIRTNRHGMRGPDFPLEKAPGEKRVLLVGDSILLGREVREGETLAARLQSGLGDPGQVRVLAAAVTGWGPDQEYLYLRERGLRFAPDLVVQFFFAGNDFGDVLRKSVANPGKTTHRPYFTLEDGRLVPHQIPVPEEERRAVIGFLSDHSALVSLFRQELVYRVGFLRKLRSRLRGVPDDPGRAPAAAPAAVSVDPETMDLVWALVRETERTARQGGARFLLVLLPRLEEVEGLVPAGALESLEARAREEDVPCLSLLPSMAGHPEHYYPRDQHLSPAGHRAAAEAMLPAVREFLGAPASGR
jgi:hypothetical protein